MNSLDPNARGTSHPCNICGGIDFVPGPLGRLTSSGLPPRCEKCGSLERHRVIRQVYDALPDRTLSAARALHFSDDPAAPKDRFQSVEVSLYEIENSLDMSAIDRGDASYDWIISNHVLEHIKDDFPAMRELLRILSDKGVLQLTVPSPATELETRDIENPEKEAWKHYRGYGSDLPLRMSEVLAGHYGFQVIGTDKTTDRWDVVYLFFKNREKMLEIGKILLQAGLPTLRCA